MRVTLLSLALLCACGKKTEQKTSETSVPPVVDAAVVPSRAPNDGSNRSMLVGLSKDRSVALVYVDTGGYGPGEYRSIDLASKSVRSRWTLHALEGKPPTDLPGIADGRDYIKEKLAHPKLADEVRMQGDALADIDEPQPGFGGKVIRLPNGGGYLVDIEQGFYLAQADGKLSRRWGETSWSEPILSPDGKTLAYLDGTHVAVSAIGVEPSPRTLDVEIDHGWLGAVRWGLDSRSLFVKTKTCIDRIDLGTKDARVTHVYCLPADAFWRRWAVLSPGRKWAGVVFNRGKGDLFAIVDLSAKRRPEEQEGPFEHEAVALAVSDDGVIVLASYDGRDPRELVVVSAKALAERTRIPSEGASHSSRLHWRSAKSLAYAWHDAVETIDIAH